LKKLKECGGFFFFNNLIATNGLQLMAGGGNIVDVRLLLGAVIGCHSFGMNINNLNK